MGTYKFTFTGSEQSFTAPSTGTYDITAYGALGGSGGGNTGGSGATYGGNFNLTAGEQLEIFTGGAGSAGTGAAATGGGGGGGGGGSFVLANTGARGSFQLLLAAGGGGGGAAAAAGGAAGYAGAGTGSGGGETSGESSGGSGYESDGANGGGGANRTGGYAGGVAHAYAGISHAGLGGNGGFGGGGAGGYSQGARYQGSGGGGGGFSGGQGGSVGYTAAGGGGGGSGGTSFDSAGTPLVAGSAATENSANQGNGLVSIISGNAVCFASGTKIRTTRGDVAVEALAIGDCVVTASGTHCPIIWLGHRTIDCRNHPRPHEVMPIRISAHAFGTLRPSCGLVVSPGHAICVDVLGEVLIPASSLVNGSTIVQADVDEVTYWHVELESHDVILAENLPAESYLDMGNRGFFSEANVVDLGAGPDARIQTHADFCRPFIAAGPVVDAVRTRLNSHTARHEQQLLRAG